jgi:hypothetical protein
MFKKILLIFIFTLLFFNRPIASFATDPNPEGTATTTGEEEISFFQKVWNWFTGQDENTNNLKVKMEAGKKFISKDFQSSTQDTSDQFTDYFNPKTDYTFKILSEKSKKLLKGLWFYEVLTNPKKYENRIIPSTGTCPEVKITDIIYYFYSQTNQKILYTRDDPSTPIDYPSDLIEATELGPSECYEYAYKNIQSVPQGPFYEIDNSDSTLLSNQYNHTIGTVISQKTQSKDTPEDDDNEEKIKKLTENSYQDYQNMLKSQIPQKAQNTQVLGVNSENYDPKKETDIVNLLENFNNYLIPQSWQKETLTTTNSTTTNGSYYVFGDPKRSDGRIKEDYDLGQTDPSHLKEFTGWPDGKTCLLDDRIFPALNDLIITFNIAFPDAVISCDSGGCYRSYEYQKEIWERNKQNYATEEEAAKHTARPGDSPHHTGRAIDFIINGSRPRDKESKYVQWFYQNGNNFGFYNYEDEPWHWEYNP